MLHQVSQIERIALSCKNREINSPAKNMNTAPSLKGVHRRTYETIFQHPVSHNLEWRAVRALLKHLGQIAEEPNGNLKVTRNGQILVLHRPHTKDPVDVDDIMTLRHFLEQSETIPVETDGKDAHWLLVIDHHSARIFRSKIHGAPPRRILPYDPKEYFRHAPDSEEDSRGKEKPEPNSFFEPVAEAMQTASQILIFGTGTGTSNEMDQFIAWLKFHHPPLAGRIIGSLVVNERHLTNDQLLAKARDFYANPPQSVKR
jgi:hypothetical protein